MRFELQTELHRASLLTVLDLPTSQVTLDDQHYVMPLMFERGQMFALRNGGVREI